MHTNLSKASAFCQKIAKKFLLISSKLGKREGGRECEFCHKHMKVQPHNLKHSNKNKLKKQIKNQLYRLIVKARIKLVKTYLDED